MVSGKYSALAGAVSREQAMENISHNLANVSTVGYKKSKVSFESLLRGARQTQEAKGINYNRVRENFTDFSPGPISTTDNPLDVAIHSEGFFKVQGPDGFLYTRSGNFHLDPEGRLLTQNGLPVLDDGNLEITIPDTDLNTIAIDSTGTISTVNNEGEAAEVGRIGIVNIENQLDLKQEADTMFSLKNGGVENFIDEPVISQGSLEISNVNMVAELSRMIASNRLFETYHKVLESYSTLGEQQDELGTVG